VLWWLIGDEDEAELKAWSAQVEEIGNGEFTAAVFWGLWAGS
jgi:hypothetical protein